MKNRIFLAACFILIFAISSIGLLAQTVPGQRTGTTQQKTGTLQVTDGTTTDQMDENSLLELQSNIRGLRLPRVELVRANQPDPLQAHVAGMTVYNTGTSLATVPYKDYVSPGLYYNDGTRWVRMDLGYSNWFYMPSVSFNTSVNAVGQTKDLYQLYYDQFANPSVKSTSAPAQVPYIPARTDLYYYITYYDTTVFSNVTIDDNGVMTYDVTASATDCSYINIVFVLK